MPFILAFQKLALKKISVLLNFHRFNFGTLGDGFIDFRLYKSISTYHNDVPQRNC